MRISEIGIGEMFIDDEGDEVTVRKIYHSRGVVVLEGEAGSYEMGAEDLLQAVADGEFEEMTEGEIDDGNSESEDEEEFAP
jgi:hypothetical protein